ncbi:MAG TPA: alpha/beta fold hydrolase [Jatrophihabitantaceae bacterium]
MRMVAVNGVELCVDTFGRPADPAILLVGGSGGSMDWWPVEFCTRLADGGRFVIRYDHRDTGQSTTYPPGAPGYTGADLVTDIVGVLDALGLRTAQLVGISMGGALAQVATLDHPDRISSLVLMSTSALHPDLAVTTDELRAFYADRAEPDWTDREAVIERIVAEDRALAGAAPFDETTSRVTAVRALDRSNDIAAAGNHAIVEGSGLWWQRLGEIRVPTLVVHGRQDPLFPLPHGEALARDIPNASLIRLDGVGHGLPPARTWDIVVPAILAL